jgi:hypothetical protein
MRVDAANILDALASSQPGCACQPAPRRKSLRGARYREEWMATQPPTERQLAYLRRLGWTGPVVSKAEASQLIDERLKGAHGGR